MHRAAAGSNRTHGGALEITQCDHSSQSFKHIGRDISQNICERDPFELWPHHEPVSLAASDDIGNFFAAKACVDR